MKANSWTADQVPDLSGKVIIVTGANTGIGFEAAREFSRKGAETILACRNESKADKAVLKIKKAFPEAKVRFIQLDLESLKSVQKFAGIIHRDYTRLDVLVNNAGIILYPYRMTKDGFESQVGINHLGHFALTGQLFDLITKTEGARVVNVSSLVYKQGRMDFENFLYHGGKGYTRTRAYARSKLANLLFTYELDRKFRKSNFDSLAVAAHPGFSYTGFGRKTIFRILKYPFYPLVTLITQSSYMGALPAVRAAVDPEVTGADFYGPGGRRERKGFPVKVLSNGASHNVRDAKTLWELSEELTGVNY